MGWNIWNIILDFTGGLLSILQLIGDSIDMGDWSGVAGKSVLAFFHDLESVSPINKSYHILSRPLLHCNKKEILQNLLSDLFPSSLM